MHPDWQRLTLAAWAKWVAQQRPLAFSQYGDSVHAQEMFRGRHWRTYRNDSPLREESEDDWLHELDSRLCGALSERERITLLAARFPWAGRARHPGGPLRRAVAWTRCGLCGTERWR